MADRTHQSINIRSRYYIFTPYCADIYRIKGILFSILSSSGPWFGEPDSVSQMMILMKTVSKINSPLFCLSVIYIQKSLKRWKKDIFAVTENITDIYWILHVKICSTCRINPRTQRPEGWHRSKFDTACDTYFVMFIISYISTMPLMIHVFYENFEFFWKFWKKIKFLDCFLIMKFYANFEFFWGFKIF